MNALFVPKIRNAQHVFLKLRHQGGKIRDEFEAAVDTEQGFAGGIEFMAHTLVLIDLVAPAQERIEYGDDVLYAAHGGALRVCRVLPLHNEVANHGGFSLVWAGNFACL